MQTEGDSIKDTTDDFSSGGSYSRPFTRPKIEKEENIEKIFMNVLGRKPSSRELAYYKYSIIKESDIILKLVNSDEHKNIIEKAFELQGVEEENKNIKISEKKLSQQLNDVNLEIDEYKKLLSEKDRIIAELREKIKNPYDFPTQIQKYEEGFDIYTRKKRTSYVKNKKKSLKEKIIDLINLLF